MSSQRKLLLGIATGVVAGLLCNALAPDSAWLAWLLKYVTEPAGSIFLRLLFMVVIPLVFSALVMGITELELGQLGRIGGKTLGYTVVASTVSVCIGLLLVNVLGPGRNLALAQLPGKEAATSLPAAASQSGVSLLVAAVPDNPIKAAASGDMTAVIVLSLLFGVALALTKTEGAKVLKSGIQGVYDVSMQLISMALKLAPIGIGALLFTMTARTGFGLIRQLAVYVAVVILGLLLHMGVTYSISLRLFSGWNPWTFFREVRLAMITAFSTASSSATLPTALKVAEENLKLPSHVSRFVLTAGSTMNQNGTALFEGVTVLFLAQLYGVELDLAQQAMVMGVCVLAGIGTAGVPAGSLPVIAMILAMVGVPPEGLALILGVDRLLDMCRTTVNVTGDLVAAAYVARGEPLAVETPSTKVGSVQ